MSQPPADRPRLPEEPSGRPRNLDAETSRQVPRYHVVLHHNPAHDLMFVVRSVMELTRFPRAEATHKMWEAYHTGRSILFTTYFERAEIYVNQFVEKGFTVTLEPATL